MERAVLLRGGCYGCHRFVAFVCLPIGSVGDSQPFWRLDCEVTEDIEEKKRNQETARIRALTQGIEKKAKKKKKKKKKKDNTTIVTNVD